MKLSQNLDIIALEIVGLRCSHHHQHNHHNHEEEQNSCSQVSGSEDEEVEEELETDGRALVERIVITLR